MLPLLPFLTNVNKAAVNIVSFQVSVLFPLDKYPDGELLAHVVVPFLFFEDAPYSFP